MNKENLNKNHINVNDVDKSPLFLVGLILLIIIVFTILISTFGKKREEEVIPPINNVEENNQPNDYVEKDKSLTCILDNNTDVYTYRITKIFTYKNSGINKVDITYDLNSLNADDTSYVENEKSNLITNNSIYNSQIGFNSNLNDLGNGFSYQTIFDLNYFNTDYIDQSMSTDTENSFEYKLNQSVSEVKNDLTNLGYYCYSNAEY